MDRRTASTEVDGTTRRWGEAALYLSTERFRARKARGERLEADGPAVAEAVERCDRGDQVVGHRCVGGYRHHRLLAGLGPHRGGRDVHAVLAEDRADAP